MALRAIRRELPLGTLIFYFGDDLTDRDAFRALKRIGISVQVGPGDPSLVDYELPDPAAVIEILGRLDHERRPGRATRKRRLPGR